MSAFSKISLAGGAFAAVLVILALAAGRRALEQDVDPATATSSAIIPSTAEASEAHEGFLYGPITTDGGTTYEGRLRWGGDEEAFWGDYFNGFKDENPWVAHVPPEHQPPRDSTRHLAVLAVWTVFVRDCLFEIHGLGLLCRDFLAC